MHFVAQQKVGPRLNGRGDHVQERHSRAQVEQVLHVDRVLYSIDNVLCSNQMVVGDAMRYPVSYVHRVSFSRYATYS